jgi:hypothetical protein
MLCHVMLNMFIKLNVSIYIYIRICIHISFICDPWGGIIEKRIIEKKSFREEASERHLGDIWEASGSIWEHLGGIWEASGSIWVNVWGASGSALGSV